MESSTLLSSTSIVKKFEYEDYLKMYSSTSTVKKFEYEYCLKMYSSTSTVKNSSTSTA